MRQETTALTIQRDESNPEWSEREAPGEFQRTLSILENKTEEAGSPGGINTSKDSEGACTVRGESKRGSDCHAAERRDASALHEDVGTRTTLKEANLLKWNDVEPEFSGAAELDHEDQRNSPIILCSFALARPAGVTGGFIHLIYERECIRVCVLVRASQVALVGKNPPANAGTVRAARSTSGSGRSPGGGHGNPLCCQEVSSIHVWRIPWTEEPGGLESIASQTVIHDWNKLVHTRGKRIWGEWTKVKEQDETGPKSSRTCHATVLYTICAQARTLPWESHQPKKEGKYAVF